MRKVVESEPEPTFTEAADSVRNLELLVTVNADFCSLTFDDELVHFKDTLMLQTRVYEATMTNSGSIALDFCWQLMMESPSNAPATRSVTFAALARSVTLVSLSSERPMTAGNEQVSFVWSPLIHIESECVTASQLFYAAHSQGA